MQLSQLQGLDNCQGKDQKRIQLITKPPSQEIEDILKNDISKASKANSAYQDDDRSHGPQFSQLEGKQTRAEAGCYTDAKTETTKQNRSRSREES